MNYRRLFLICFFALCFYLWHFCRLVLFRQEVNVSMRDQPQELAAHFAGVCDWNPRETIGVLDPLRVPDGSVGVENDRVSDKPLPVPLWKSNLMPLALPLLSRTQKFLLYQHSALQMSRALLKELFWKAKRSHWTLNQIPFMWETPSIMRSYSWAGFCFSKGQHQLLSDPTIQRDNWRLNRRQKEAAVMTSQTKVSWKS